MIDCGSGIYTIDVEYKQPGLASSHLIVESGRAAFVDVGTSTATPLLLGALDRLGLGPESVDWVLTTHVHLDHAGGAGTLIRALPEARVVVHPRGARHLIDPTRLIAGAEAVYGAEEVARLYGEIAPVPAERVVEAPEGFSLALAGRRLRFLDTPGHARHHFCVWDEASRGIFTGDCFGLSYAWADSERGAWVLPTTSPVHFDPVAMHDTLDRLLALAPSHAYLTHFGQESEVERLGSDLRRLLEAMVALAESLADAPDRGERLVAGLWRLYLEDLEAHRCRLPEAEIRERLALDVQLNAQGLEVWLDRRG